MGKILKGITGVGEWVKKLQVAKKELKSPRSNSDFTLHLLAKVERTILAGSCIS
jgi:hypothetical protein